MVLTIVALDSAGKVVNWIMGGADLRLRFSSRILGRFPLIVGVCVRIRSGADGEDGNSNGDGAGDCDHCTRSTYTSRLAMSTSASKLPQT